MHRSCTEVEWFEDYRVGDEFLGEPVYFSEKEIVDFARKYDPQPFHVDPAAASASPYEGHGEDDPSRPCLYLTGVGTSWHNWLTGGPCGRGLSENMREGYA